MPSLMRIHIFKRSENQKQHNKQLHYMLYSTHMCFINSVNPTSNSYPAFAPSVLATVVYSATLFIQIS